MSGTTAALTLRAMHYTDAGVDAEDARACVAIVQAHETALLGTVETTAAEVEESLTQPYVDRDATALVLDGDEPVACVWLEGDPIARQSFFVVHAMPGDRSDAAVALAVAHSVTRGQEHASRARDDGLVDRDAVWTLRSGSWLEDSRHFAVLETHGFEPVRRFHQMRIDATSPEIPAAAPPLPDGVRIVVARDEETYRTAYDVDCAAFADHWNFTPHPYDDWRAELVDSSTRDPDGIWLLTVDDVPAGFCLVDRSRLELGDGYVGILGVAREFRGRGLAQLLLRTAFVRGRELGRRGTRLGVDAANTTGAVRLYEGVGMRAVRTREAWALEI